MLFFVAACEREVVVPQYLTGKWTTSAPKYTDRYLKLCEHTVIYGVGDGEEVLHTIDKIDIQQVADGTVVTLYYRDADGEKTTLNFTYSPYSGGTLQLKNSKEIWEKDKSGAAGC